MKRNSIAYLLCLIICVYAFNSNSKRPLAEQKQKTGNRFGIEEESFGAWINPAGDPIGGGTSYSRIITHGDYHVSSREELLDALKKAKPGQIVYVDDNTAIDLTGMKNIEIPGGITLASGRNGESVKGALIYSIQLDTTPLFATGGDNVRITGIRLRGPDQERRTEQLEELSAEGGREAYYRISYSDGIQSTHSDLEVDNCELWGWSHAAVSLKKGATKAHIHHNYIHHNQRYGLGYGVCLDQSDALIEANLFDWCRHHIAGTGSPGTSYEACYNIVFENANGHSFDMHGGRDRDDGTEIAGDLIKIHHNLFLAIDVTAVVIRGIPTQKAEIHHNWFLHPTPEKAIRQGAWSAPITGNMEVYRNQYTESRIIKD
ncbi:hypothetical protein ES707_06809 [subsurface metagenome]